MGSDPTAKPKTGLSLYANLLGGSSTSEASVSAVISGAPVIFKQPNGGEARADDPTTQKQQISAAALRFQPTKRPQIASQKPTHKITSAKAVSAVPAVPVAPAASEQAAPAQRQTVPATKTTIADWTGDGDDDANGFYGEKRQRGGRKKRKKNKEESQVPQNWDDIYDPTRPNNYEEYKNSEEKYREIREWKDRLYAHRMARRSSDFTDSEDERPAARMNNQFAPPPIAFAPPPEFDNPPPPPAEIPEDESGEDAFARRMRMSQQHNQSSPAQNPANVYPPPPPLSAPKPAPPMFQNVHTISRAPVRYNLPEAPAELPQSEAELENALQQEQEETQAETTATANDAPRSLRPGQKGFAERLMSKYGWTKGSGLGANQSGIVNPLRVQVEKQKKKPDSDGGGFVGPSGMGKIIGGKKKAGSAEAEGKFGLMSEVVILRGMVDGMDLDYEMGEGNLMQEIGEECGEKYGRVERVYIDRNNPNSAPVYIKFTNQLSALRAVNALEGRVFNGNAIVARFFDNEKFEKEVLAS